MNVPHRLLASLVIGLASASLSPAEWSVPLGGNAFRAGPAPGDAGVSRSGGINWSDAEGVFAVFFHVNRAAALDLSLNARVPEGRSTIVTRVLGRAFTNVLDGSEWHRQSVGRIEVPAAGYVRVELQGLERSGRAYAEIRDLLVAADEPGLSLDYVKTNQGNMFYWGRRGPSVHLGYQTPADRKLQFAYTEITVPEGQDTLGSYFMANGFGEGYFGFQVNSATERRVLFSVWSPFQTDNPRNIPAEQRIDSLGKGPEVHVGEFGNEGSGGQSYLVYPWKAGKTYRFLTEVKPDGQGRTVYTSWFGDKAAGEWRLIASFRRPKTDTTLRGFHSFLENFAPTTGHLGRRAEYGNVWVRDTEGQWHEITQARFSVDPTGRGRHRLDFTGGAEGDHFYLRNCGFFNETGRPGEVFTRQSTAAQKPEVNLESLPRG